MKRYQRPPPQLLSVATALQIEKVAATICAMAAAWRGCRVPENLGRLEAAELLQVYVDDLGELMRGVAKASDVFEENPNGK